MHPSDPSSSSSDNPDVQEPTEQEENTECIHFTQDWDVGLGGGLWSTGLAMAKYFQQHASDIRFDLMRLSQRQGSDQLYALELGSGNGYLSCSFAYHFGSLCKVSG